MKHEIVIDMDKKKDFDTNGVCFKFNKKSLTVNSGSSKYLISFSKDNISYSKELLSVIDPRNYTSGKTIIFDIDRFKEVLEQKSKAKRDSENRKNAAATKNMLLTVYVVGEFKNVGIDINIKNALRPFWIDDYWFRFDYNDDQLLNLNFEDLEISGNWTKYKFSEFLKATAVKLKNLIDAKNILDKLESELNKEFGLDEDEDDDEDDDE